jgi:hypothetical protein
MYTTVCTKQQNELVLGFNDWGMIDDLIFRGGS